MDSQGEMGQKANLPSVLAVEIRGFDTEENSIKLGLIPDWRISFFHMKAQDWRNLSQIVEIRTNEVQGCKWYRNGLSCLPGHMLMLCSWGISASARITGLWGMIEGFSERT